MKRANVASTIHLGRMITKTQEKKINNTRSDNQILSYEKHKLFCFLKLPEILIEIYCDGAFPFRFSETQNAPYCVKGENNFIPVNNYTGNSMSNHPGHVTFTSKTFLNFLPVVGIIEI